MKQLTQKLAEEKSAKAEENDETNKQRTTAEINKTLEDTVKESEKKICALNEDIVRKKTHTEQPNNKDKKEEPKK